MPCGPPSLLPASTHPQGNQEQECFHCGRTVVHVSNAQSQGSRLRTADDERKRQKMTLMKLLKDKEAMEEEGEAEEAE